MAKTVEFTVNSPRALTAYLKKFSALNSTLLFEIDFENSQLISKSPNEERSIVKFAALPFGDSGLDLQTKSPNVRIKIGIYNISRLINIIDQFDKGFTLIVKYDEIMGSNNIKDYAATSILVKNDELQFNNECTSLNIFKYISDDLYHNTIKNISEITSFTLSKEHLEKISALLRLDKDYKLVQFKVQKGNLYIKGKSFKYLLSVTDSSELSLDFYKEQLEKIDNEECKVTIGLDRILFSSDESNTETIISKVEGNDKFEETVEDF